MRLLPELRMVNFLIHRALLQECFVSPLAHHPAIIQYQNPVGMANGRRPLRNHKGGRGIGQSAYGGPEPGIRGIVQG